MAVRVRKNGVHVENVESHKTVDGRLIGRRSRSCILALRYQEHWNRVASRPVSEWQAHVTGPETYVMAVSKQRIGLAIEMYLYEISSCRVATMRQPQ